MSTLNFGDTNVFTDLGKIVYGTNVTNTFPSNTSTNAMSLALTKGTWLLVWCFRCDQINRNYRTFGGFTGAASMVGGYTDTFTAVEIRKLTANTTLYATVWPEGYSLTFSSGSKVCFAVKLA